MIVLLLLHIALLLGLFFWTWRRFPQPLFSLALVAKILGGIALGVLYQYYYGFGDTLTFFQDAQQAAAMLREHPKEFFNFFWLSDWSKVGGELATTGLNPLYMVKWVTFFSLLTDDNYWLVATDMSIISFAGTWILFKSISLCYSTIRKEAAVAILFIPSVVFWGSGVIKESLALGALFALSGFFICWYNHSTLRWWNVMVALIALWILWWLKYYWLAVWLAVVIPLSVTKVLSVRFQWFKQHRVLSWLFIFFAAVILVSVLHPNFYYYRIAGVVVDNYQAYIRISSPEDVITHPSLEPTFTSLVKNAPVAVISGFFRPFMWEASSALQVAMATENLILLSLFVMSFVRFKKWSNCLNELHFALFVYVIMLAAFLALSTPNFGSLSRYRIGFTPFLWLAMLVASGVVSYLPNPIQKLLNASFESRINNRNKGQD